MTFLIPLALGALFNIYRGGLFSNRDKIVARVKPEWLRKIVHFLVQGDTVNAVAFGLFCVMAHASVYQGILDGSPTYIFVSGAFALFLVQVVMMFRGSTPAWGEYIGAAGGWRPVDGEPLKPEVHYIDKLIAGLKDRPRLWGVAGLSLRCAEWGLFIGVPLVGLIGLQAFLPMLAGLLAGPIVYVLSISPVKKYTWKIFEAVIGALFWVSCS